MEIQTKNEVEVQGTETEKKVQVSISILKELAGDKKLLEKFIEIINEPDMKSTMAIAIARREVKK